MSNHDPLPIPDAPLPVALIGAGQRSTTIYAPVLASLAPWIRITAVCDPIREHADTLSAQLDARAYYNIHQLMNDRPMEAVLIVTPIPSHHALSVYCSSHRMPHMTETSMCSLLMQGRDMVDSARNNKTVFRVAENFFRFPIDRIVQEIMRSNMLGRVQRIVSYADHTGYHNNSRWLVMAGDHPDWVQSIEHTMPTASFHSTRERFHTDETYKACFFGFPDNRLVMDHAANVKGFLGRHRRPGYTEWQGERGTVVHYATPDGGQRSEVRFCSDEGLEAGRGRHDHTIAIDIQITDDHWTGISADMPDGQVSWQNLYPPVSIMPDRPWYVAAVQGHLIDFVEAVHGIRDSEFTDEDALMSMMMYAGARESARQQGKRLTLPLEGDIDIDQQERQSLKEQLGVDPMDVEGMLAVTYPKP